MTRRRASQLLGWWVALGAAPALAQPRGAGGLPSSSQKLPPQLVRAQTSALAIGRLYLEGHSEFASSDALASALGLAGIDIDALDRDEASKQRERLRAQHRADFEEDRIDELGGYYLSTTEVHLAALITLVSR